VNPTERPPRTAQSRCGMPEASLEYRRRGAPSLNGDCSLWRGCRTGSRETEFHGNLHQIAHVRLQTPLVISESLSGIMLWSTKKSYAGRVRSTVSAPLGSLTFRFIASSRLSQRAGTTFVTKFSK